MYVVSVTGWWGQRSTDLQEDAQLSLPQINRLFETSFVCDESSASTGDVAVISSQDKVTVQILSHCQVYIALKLSYTDSCSTEELSLLSQQCMVGTVEDSVLRTEMTGLESQEEDDPNRILFFNPMSWLGQIRSHRSDET